MFDHAAIDDYPAIKAYRDRLLRGMDWFAQADVAESLDAFLAYCDEVFRPLLDNLVQRSGTRILVVEGAYILPRLAQRYLKNQSVLFLTCSKEQQRLLWHQEMEGLIPGRHPGERDGFASAKNKLQVEEVRIEFHHRLARHIEQAAAEGRFTNIRLNNDTTMENLVSLVESEFGLA